MSGPRSDRPGPAATEIGPIAEAAAAARAGRLIVIPTDTVYGIATRPDDPAATDRLFEAKGRPDDLPLPVLVASTDAARGLAVFDGRAERLAGELWPGALTLVLPRGPATHGWPLGGAGETIGVRVPRHPLALAVLSLTGPLAATSANRSGDPTPPRCDGLHEVFGDRVDVYLCEQEDLTGRPSSVVDLTGPEPRLLRSGDLDAEGLARLLS